MPLYLLRQKPAASGSFVRPDVDYESGDDFLEIGSIVKLDDGFDWKIVDFVADPPEPYEAVALVSRV